MGCIDDVIAMIDSLNGSIVIGSLKGSKRLKILEMISRALYFSNRIVGVLDVQTPHQEFEMV